MPKRSRSFSVPSGRSLKRRNAMGYSSRPSLATKVNKLIRSQELKNNDVTATTLSTTAVGVVVSLNTILAGDDITQRNGRKITLNSSMLRWHGFMTDGVVTAPASYRVVLVYDRQPNGTAPVWLDVFQTAVATTDRNVNNRDRFKIVYDNFMSAKKGYLNIVSSAGAGGTGYESGFYDQTYKKLRNMTSEYASTASAVPLHGGFYLMVLTDQPGTMAYYHRLTFTDS